MKTTVEIPDALWQKARAVATREGTTLRALVERGLRHVLREAREGPRRPFRLRDASFRGQGLQQAFADGNEPDWTRIRAAGYGALD